MSYKQKEYSKYRYCPECRQDLSGVDTYECGCSHIICYDCYQEIKQKKGNCPNCQKQYLQKIQDYTQERKKVNYINKFKVKQPYHKKSYNQDLTNVRVIKKNLVYCIGLSPQLAKEDLLSGNSYFGQYGNITKIVVNKENIYNAKGKTPSLSAFITYASEREASVAILAIEEYQIQDRTIRASYGTTKYCTSFLKNQECPNMDDCLYLHSLGKEKDSFAKDEIQNNKSIFVEQQKIAIKCIFKYIPELIKQKVLYDIQKPQPQLPHPSTIIQKLIQEDVVSQSKFDYLYNQELQKQEEISKEGCNKKKIIDHIKSKKSQEQPLVDQWDIDIPVVSQDKDSIEQQKSKQEKQKHNDENNNKQPNTLDNDYGEQEDNNIVNNYICNEQQFYDNKNENGLIFQQNDNKEQCETNQTQNKQKNQIEQEKLEIEQPKQQLESLMENKFNNIVQKNINNEEQILLNNKNNINNQQQSVQISMINELFDDNLNNQVSNLSFCSQDNINKQNKQIFVNQKQDQSEFYSDNQQKHLYFDSKNENKINYTQSLNNIETIINQSTSNKSSRFEFAKNTNYIQKEEFGKIKSEQFQDINSDFYQKQISTPISASLNQNQYFDEQILSQEQNQNNNNNKYFCQQINSQQLKHNLYQNKQIKPLQNIQNSWDC